MKKIVFILLLTFLYHLPAYAEGRPEELKDCPRAQLLPNLAGEDSRRIACNIPEDLQEQVTLSEFFGRQLRLYDIAAWLTTDSLKEAGAFTKKNIPGQMQGWLTFDKGSSVNVRYYAKKDDHIFAFAQADFDKGTIKSINNDIFKAPIPATETELNMLSALNTAKSQELMNCTGPFNSVVIPFTVSDKEEIRVYLFSPWTEKVAPLGGHHLIRTSENGNEVISKYSQTKSCINNDAKQMNDKNMSAIMISHLTSDTPTEMHAFLSMQYKKPIYVMTMTNGITWIVEGSKISLLDRMDGKKPFEPSTKKIEGMKQ